MHSVNWFVQGARLAFVFALATGVAGCDVFGSSDEPGCVGAESCACTAGGACDPGLSCAAGTCMKSIDVNRTDGGATDAPTVSVDPAVVCSEIQKYCEKLNQCGPLLISIVYGSVATCTERLKLECVDGVKAPDSGLNSATVAACTAALATASCEDVIYRNVAACNWKGTRANGGSCGADEQCVSGHCAQNDSACGVCAEPMRDGASCLEDEDCAPGRVCSEDDHCVIPGAAGTGCSATQPCRYGNYCRNGSCVATSNNPGDSCADPGSCNILNGAYCRTETQTCARIAFNAPGDHCELSTRAIIFCAGGVCITPTGSDSGTCAAHAKDGEPCGAQSDNNRNCQDPARCIAGRCKLPNSAACN